MDLYDEIYYSLIGEMNEDAALAWVPNAFAEGSACDAAYNRLLTARNNLLEKLGCDEDPELSRMLEEMDTISHLLCREVMALRRL